MHRWMMRYLPVFMLALTVQMLAPIGACLATAIAASDSLSAAVLCRDAGADHAPEQQPLHHMRDGSCAACAVGAPCVPPVPADIGALMARETYRVSWHAAAPVVRAAKLASSAQARAPPTQS